MVETLTIRETVETINHLRTDHFEALQTLQSSHKGIIVFPIPGKPIHLITDPEIVRYVFGHDGARIDKDSSDAVTLEHVVGGPNVFTTTGTDSIDRRKSLQPIISGHDGMRENLSEAVSQAIKGVTGTWLDSADINLGNELQTITSMVLATTLAGETAADLISAQLIGDVNQVIRFYSTSMRGLTLPWHTRYLTSQGRSFLAARNRLRDKFDEMTQTHEFQDTFQAHEFSKRSQAELIDEVFTLFFAGHATTANALTWIMTALTDRPELVEQIRSGDLNCRNVFREGLRLYPPFWIISRRVNEPFNVEGENESYTFPKNSLIAYSPFAIHTDKKYWENSGKFEPERWDRGGNSRAYFPFGTGSRSCLGAGFAMIEGPQIIDSFYKMFDIEVTNRDRIVPDLGMATFVPTSVQARAKRI